MEACWAHNPEVRGSKPRSARNFFSPPPTEMAVVYVGVTSWRHWSVGVVVITSALHAEGRQFDPGTDHVLLPTVLGDTGTHVRMAEWSKAPDSRLQPCPLIGDERRFLVLL